MTATITIDAAGRLDAGVRMVKRDGRLVIAAGKVSSDACAAVKASREDRDEIIVRRVRGKSFPSRECP